MNSLADIKDEYHCHRDFYKCVRGNIACKYCGSRGIKFRRNYEYCPHCKRKSSVKGDTKVFSFCNLTFRQIYILIWCWQKKCSIGEIVNISGLSYPTIKRWLTRFRASLEPREEVLEGICEVDGSFFGRRKFGKQKLVAGVICKARTKKGYCIRLKIVEKRDRDHAEAFIEETIKPGSVVVTDGFKGYNEIETMGYEWFACDHSIGFFGPTNHIENLWSVIKRALRYIYKDLTFDTRDLKLILREYETRYNNEKVFYNVDNYLKMRACSKFVY